MLGIVALVCQQPTAALARPALLAEDASLIQVCLSIRDVAGLTRRQQNAQRHPVGIANHVDLGGQAASAASHGSSGPPFFHGTRRNSGCSLRC